MAFRWHWYDWGINLLTWDWHLSVLAKIKMGKSVRKRWKQRDRIKACWWYTLKAQELVTGRKPGAAEQGRGQRKHQVFLCPWMLPKCSAPCPYSGTWRTQLPGWVSESEERHPERSGQTGAQVALGVQFGLLRFPSLMPAGPGNEAIAEHRVSGTQHWACANEGQRAGVTKSENALPTQMRGTNCSSSVQEDRNIPL